MTGTGRTQARLALAAGLVLVSTSGPFLIMADLDPLATSFWRMALGAILLLGWARATGPVSVPRELRGQLALGGLLLAAHFGLWIGAFELTSYSSNLLLLVAQPVFAALLGMRLGEKTGRATWLSLALALVGLSLLAGGDLSLGPRALVGDAFCLLGDLAIALFYVVTRHARARLPMATFLGWILVVGALATLPVALATGTRLVGYRADSWAWLMAIVIMTTAGGHGLLNVAARGVRLFTLNIVIVVEPALGILFGSVLFGATITTFQLVGGAILAVAALVGLGAD